MPYKGPKVGQEAYDTATGRMGVLQAIHDVSDLAFDHAMPGPRVAFLRPAEGGEEWLTDPGNIRFPREAQTDPDSNDESPWS
ncbi:hypothetical protein [Streptomyces milbemycinicus]|uniref:Uncharacterized protein n=1 Tax=Streptomyces milbemycinicus TaxID=476552 RepID=A0ABW8LWA5_9ACTN